MRSSLSPLALPFYPSSVTDNHNSKTDFNATTVAMDPYNAYYANTHAAYMDTYNPPTYYTPASASAYTNPYAYKYVYPHVHGAYHGTQFVPKEVEYLYSPSSPVYPPGYEPPSVIEQLIWSQEARMGKGLNGGMGKGVNAGKFKNKKKKNKGWKRKDFGEEGEHRGGWKRDEGEQYGGWKRDEGGEERGRTMVRKGEEGLGGKIPKWEW